jgi:hypothetical protein
VKKIDGTTKLILMKIVVEEKITAKRNIFVIFEKEEISLFLKRELLLLLSSFQFFGKG